MESSRSSRSPSPADERRLIDSWQPEPLVPDLQDDERRLIQKPHMITSKPGHMIEVDGKLCLNAGTHNYLNLADSPRLKEASLKAVKKYGVGSCGPRAFYGTMDVHLKLEEAIAKFLDVQEAVLYSFGFATIASAIPAYIKANDTVLYDEQCNFALQKGIAASRSRAIKFRHNSTADLKTKLAQIVQESHQKHGKKKELRFFLIIESIYAKTGTICPLRELIEVAKQHKMRVFMDESRSFGVLGAGGKGITQHLNVSVDEIDLIMVSLENALCSFGGFCAGSRFIIDHQRLAGAGYCFSASLPPFQCSAALEALEIIEENPSLVQAAQDLFEYAHEKSLQLTYLKCLSHSLSPIKILVPKKMAEDEQRGGAEQNNNSNNYDNTYDNDDDDDDMIYSKEHEMTLEKICNDILVHDQIAISMSRYLKDEEATCPPAAIKLIINAGMNRADIDRIFTVLERSSVRYGPQIAQD